MCRAGTNEKSRDEITLRLFTLTLLHEPINLILEKTYNTNRWFIKLVEKFWSGINPNLTISGVTSRNVWKKSFVSNLLAISTQFSQITV